MSNPTWKMANKGFARPVLMLDTDVLEGACVYKLTKSDVQAGWPKKDLGRWFYEEGGSPLGWCRTKEAAQAKIIALYKKYRPTLKALRQAMRDFANFEAGAIPAMSRQEIVDFLNDQLAEMRREPDNARALQTILGAEANV